jgi:hypothetical protein
VDRSALIPISAIDLDRMDHRRLYSSVTTRERTAHQPDA